MSNSTYQVPSHEIDIRRPNGQLETVTMPCGGHINARIFAEAKAANARAGRGELLAWRNIEKTVERTDAQEAEYQAGLRQAAVEAAERKANTWQHDPRYGFATERDECSDHGSRREPVYKED